MAYDVKGILFYGAMGLLAAILIIASVSLSPTILLQVFPQIFPPVTAKTGTLLVKVTDAPVPDLKHLNLTIDSIEVCNETGGWTALTIPGGKASFDLLQLLNVTRDLVEGEIPPGNYTKIRMRIVEGLKYTNATLGDRVIELNVPPGHIDIHVRFEIKAGKTTIVIIDIIVDKVHIAERGKSGKPANLNPQFKTIVSPP